MAVVHDLSRSQASLAYWVPAVAGNTTVWLIGIVNFKNQIAHLAWSDALDIAHIVDYGIKPRNPVPVPGVVGRSPHQELLVRAPWETSDDNQSYAVRQYSFEVGRVRLSRGAWAYQAFDDSRSLVGVKLSTTLGTSGTPKVAYVYPGSPADGELRVGDFIEAVVGAKPPPEAMTLNGPWVIDEVALFYPGQKINLAVDRNGRFLDLPITLGRWTPRIEDYDRKGNNFLVTM